METVLVTVAAIAGAAWLIFAVYRLGEARSRLALLRTLRRKDAGRRSQS
jgi:hypothetical protein